MALFGLFTRSQDNSVPKTSPGDGLGTGVLPPARSTLEITEHTALQIGAFIVAFKSSAPLAQLPMMVKRGQEDVVSPLANRPDLNITTNDLGSTATSLALTGNDNWVSRNQAGEVKNLEVLNPRAVVVSHEDRPGAPFHSITTASETIKTSNTFA